MRLETFPFQLHDSKNNCELEFNAVVEINGRLGDGERACPDPINGYTVEIVATVNDELDAVLGKKLVARMASSRGLNTKIGRNGTAVLNIPGFKVHCSAAATTTTTTYQRVGLHFAFYSTKLTNLLDLAETAMSSLQRALSDHLWFPLAAAHVPNKPALKLTPKLAQSLHIDATKVYEIINSAACDSPSSSFFSSL